MEFFSVISIISMLWTWLLNLIYILARFLLTCLLPVRGSMRFLWVAYGRSYMVFDWLVVCGWHLLIFLGTNLPPLRSNKVSTVDVVAADLSLGVGIVELLSNISQCLSVLIFIYSWLPAKLLVMVFSKCKAFLTQGRSLPQSLKLVSSLGFCKEYKVD